MKNNRSVIEKKKRQYLGIVVVVFAIIAILGYALEKKAEPMRVAFDTQGGGVIFNHKVHTTLKNTQCQECHHNFEEAKKDESLLDCRRCHYNREYVETLTTDEPLHKRLIGKNCTGCHKEGSVTCEFCHNAENFSQPQIPDKVEFVTDAGKVQFDHLTHASEDGYGLGCDSCHHGYKPENKKTFPWNCRRCHYNKKYKDLCEDEDTHVVCIGKSCLDCHSDGAEKCEICHKE